MQKTKAAVLFILMTVCPLDSHAYLREDHHYSVRVILNALAPPMEGEALVGICSQLPDETPEISAIDVYRRLMRHPVDYLRWTVQKKGPADTVGRMVTIHELQHGLTGGHPEAVRKVAQHVIGDVVRQIQSHPGQTPQEKADDFCALGLAIHLYGDAFSHQMIKNPEKMYRAGIGHLFDSTKPDLPLYSMERFLLWKRYLSTLADLIPHSELADLHMLMQEMEDSQPRANNHNGYFIVELRKLFTGHLELRHPAKPILPFDRRLKPRGCQAMADWQSKISGISPAPDCGHSWIIFRDFAIQEYALYDHEHPDQPSRERNQVPYFLESPFADKRP